MKTTIGDRVVDILLERAQAVRTKLNKDYKHTKPFREEMVTPEERIFWYRDLSQEDVQYLVEAHGPDKVKEEFMEIEQLERRRGL